MKSSVKEILARRISFSIAFVVACAAQGALGLEGNRAGKMAFSSFAGAPLYFEGNAGQVDGTQQFIARGAECNVLLAPTEAEIILGKSSNPAATSGGNAPRAVHLQLVGANAASKITGRDQLAARANYFIGNEPAKWHTGVPLFSKVQVSDVYPGVQVVYYANQSAQLEYDFLLQPGAQPEQIRFRIAGADKVQVDDAGNMALKIGDEEIRQHTPVVYQENGGVRTKIPASYHLNADGTVGFALAEYDHSLPLVIDPVLDFLTYMGGKKMEIGWAIALDGATNIYVAGETLSKGLLTTNAFVHNNIDYSEFQGGNNAFGDAFVAKYDNSGALQFLTYLGGKIDDGALAIAFDRANNAVWVTGFTDSTNFPLQNPIRPALTGPNKNAKRVFAVDAFISELDPSGTNLLFSTYFGGENVDEGVGITVDANGGVYVTGLTSSTNLPGLLPTSFQSTNAGKLDAFVTKLISTGPNTYTNAYTTYLGGTNIDYGISIAVDSKLDAWVTGLTYSTNFYTTNALQLVAGDLGTGTNTFFPDGYTFTNLNTQTNSPKHNSSDRSDAFITELSPDGTTVPFSTYLGGSNDDVGEHITIDNFDNVFVTGYTLSRNFPTNRITTTQLPDDSNNYVFPDPGTNFLSHVFVTEIKNQALAYSVHFGGNLADQGFGIAVDNNGLTYVTGSASSTNFYPVPFFFTNSAPSKHDHSITNYFGFPTNSPVFTNLSNTNITVKLKHKGNTNDIFVAVLSPEFTNFNYQILLGGPGEDEANAIAVDPSGGAVYLVGSTSSRTNFATTNAAQEIIGSPKGGRNIFDAFIGRIQIVPSP